MTSLSEGGFQGDGGNPPAQKTTRIRFLSSSTKKAGIADLPCRQKDCSGYPPCPELRLLHSVLGCLAVVWVYLNSDVASVQQFGCFKGAAGPAESIKNNVSALAEGRTELDRDRRDLEELTSRFENDKAEFRNRQEQDESDLRQRHELLQQKQDRLDQLRSELDALRQKTDIELESLHASQRENQQAEDEIQRRLDP